MRRRLAAVVAVCLCAWVAATLLRPRQPFATICVRMPELLGRGEAALPQDNRLPDGYAGPSLFDLGDRPTARVVRRRYGAPQGQGIAHWTLEAVFEPSGGGRPETVSGIGVRFDSEYFGGTGRMPQSNQECLVSCGFEGPYRVLCVRGDGRAAINECQVALRHAIVVTYWGDFGCWVVCVADLGGLPMLQQLQDTEEHWPGYSSLVSEVERPSRAITTPGADSGRVALPAEVGPRR